MVLFTTMDGPAMHNFFLTRLWKFWTQSFPDCLLSWWPVFAAKYLLCILGLNLGCGLDPVLVTFSLCSDKILNKSNSKKGRIILAQSFRVWKAWRQEQEAASHIFSSVRRQKETDDNAQLAFSSLFGPEARSIGWSYPHPGWLHIDTD